MNTPEKPRKQKAPYVGPGKWLGFTLLGLREHRETPALDSRPPARLVVLSFINSLSMGFTLLRAHWETSELGSGSGTPARLVFILLSIYYLSLLSGDLSCCLSLLRPF